MGSLDDDFVIAVFHKVGRGYRFGDNRVLRQLFSEATGANEYLASFFRLHQTYHDCKNLSRIISLLVIGELLISEGVDCHYCISDNLAGMWGKEYFDTLTIELQSIADNLAENIRRVNRKLKPNIIETISV